MSVQLERELDQEHAWMQDALDATDECFCHILHPRVNNKQSYICGTPRKSPPQHPTLYYKKGTTYCACGNAICPDCLLIDRDLP